MPVKACSKVFACFTAVSYTHLNVKSSEIYKAVINVTERMTYTDVQKILDNSDVEIIKKYKKYIDIFKSVSYTHLIRKKYISRCNRSNKRRSFQ